MRQITKRVNSEDKLRYSATRIMLSGSMALFALGCGSPQDSDSKFFNGALAAGFDKDHTTANLTVDYEWISKNTNEDGNSEIRHRLHAGAVVEIPAAGARNGATRAISYNNGRLEAIQEMSSASGRLISLDGTAQYSSSAHSMEPCDYRVRLPREDSGHGSGNMSDDGASFYIAFDDQKIQVLQMSSGLFDYEDVSIVKPCKANGSKGGRLRSSGQMSIDADLSLDAASMDSGWTIHAARTATGYLLQASYSKVEKSSELNPQTTEITCKETIRLEWPGRVRIEKLEQKGGQRTLDPRQMVFHDGPLTLVADARVAPQDKAFEVTWDAPDIGDQKAKVKSRVVEPGLVRAEITYARLPARNEAFGRKQLTARLADDSDEAAFEVFFERDARDHPVSSGDDAGTPNWFFYWKQGVVPELDRFQYTEDPKMGGGYSLQNRTLCVTPSSPGLIPDQDVILYTSDGAHTYHLVRKRVTGIKAVAAVVRHEQRHKELYDAMQWPGGRDPYWKGDGTIDYGVRAGNDYDYDFVPDDQELGNNPWLDVFKSNTYANFTIGLFFADPSEAPQAQAEQIRLLGDNELLAIISEQKAFCREDQDWAFPGTHADATGE